MAETDGPEKLKRERAGTYRTSDERFTVEQSSSGWLLLDAEQTNELGLPLARGPFATLDEAREAITAARKGPAPKVVDIADRSRSPKKPTTPAKRSEADDVEAKEGAANGERAPGRRAKRAKASKPAARRPA